MDGVFGLPIYLKSLTQQIRPQNTPHKLHSYSSSSRPGIPKREKVELISCEVKDFKIVGFLA
jgi:hypothetical protein